MEHKMRLADDYFYLMKKGKKKIEIRLNDEKRQLLNIGDIIIFERVGNQEDKIKTRIVDLNIYNTFSELMDNYDVKDYGKEDDTKDSLLEVLGTFYSKEEENKYKALAIKVEVLEKSCGVVVFNNDTVLLVKHNSGHYGIPKGHVELGETETETAKREVKEETNIDCEIIDGFRSVITYSPKENVIKDVVFFVGKALSFDTIKQDIEISEVKFVPIDEAVDLVEYDDMKKVVKEAIEFYKNR